MFELSLVQFYSFANNQSNKINNKFKNLLLFDDFFIQEIAKNTYRKYH